MSKLFFRENDLLLFLKMKATNRDSSPAQFGVQLNS